MDALQELNETIEHVRSSLSPSQLKKLRKKRAKLLQQAAHQEVSLEEPAAKRPCLHHSTDDAEPSMSLQLSSHGPGTLAAHTDQEAVSQRQSGLAAHHHHHHHQQQQQQHLKSHHQGPTQQQISGLPPLQQQQQQQHGTATSDKGTGIKHKLRPAVPASSTSTGPCRTDLSGQLAVIQQELHSTDDNSNSTFDQLLLQPPVAQAGSDCSLGNPQVAHSGGGHQHAHPAAAAAASSGQQQQMQTQQQQQQQQQSRKRSRPSCQYGNYHHYYGYRLKPSGFEDPRLKVLDPAWFQGADVLDVGCNEGLVTLALAVHCSCRSVSGVDIDPVLVAKACTNLSRSRTQLNQQLHQAVRERNAQSIKPRRLQLQHGEQQQAGHQQQQQHDSGPLGIISASTMQPAATQEPAANGTPAGHAADTHSTLDASSSKAAKGQAAAATAKDCSKQQQSKQPGQQQRQQQPPHAQRPQQQQQQQPQVSPKARILSTQRQIKALSRVSFRAGNWLEVPCASNKYEVITCFSVTKWIQLNWGDDGIMKLFHKFYRCLAPGGLLVLEPQPFKSYKNAIHKPGVQAAPFVDLEQLKLRPEQYAQFLTERVGFELVQQLNAVSEAAGADAVSVKGFDRPILVLRKPGAGSRKAPAAAAAARVVDGSE